MSKYQKKINEIKNYLPDEDDLPANFILFAELNLPEEIGWSNVERYELKSSAKKDLIPFWPLGDGGTLAFWYFETNRTIVYLGSEGELELIAKNFDAFLELLKMKKTGLSIFDDSSEEYKLPTLSAKANQIDALKTQFLTWFKEHTTLLEPHSSKGSEDLRLRIMEIAENILTDGLCKTYTTDSFWWSLSFRISINAREISIFYLDYGKWYSLPQKYGLKPEIEAILQLVKNKDKNKYELSVSSPGIVSVDRDTELVLTGKST